MLRRTLSCPAPASTPFQFNTDAPVSDLIQFGSSTEDYYDDCVGSVVPRDGDCIESAVENEEKIDEEYDEEDYEDGDALLKKGDIVSPKSRGAVVNQISKIKSVGARTQQLSGTKKYVPFGITKNLNKGSPRSPTSPTFGADLLKSPFQKLEPKRLEEVVRVMNRANKMARQAGRNDSDGE